MWIVVSLCALVAVSGCVGVFLLTRFPNDPRGCAGPGRDRRTLTACRR